MDTLRLPLLAFFILLFLGWASGSATPAEGMTSPRVSPAGALGTLPDPTPVSLFCATYTSHDTPMNLIDQGIVTSTLLVGDLFTLADVNVLGLNIEHTSISDLTATLISPNGTRVPLFINVGKPGDQNFVDVAFDDEAATFIFDATAPFSGTHKAQGYLGDLDRQLAQGEWHLQISDVSVNDMGVLTGWALDLCASKSLPQPVATPTSSVFPNLKLVYLPLIAR